ncbi:MAG: hypothetical protein ABW178_01190, partial [Pseudoxanthomonas sp.]
MKQRTVAILVTACLLAASTPLWSKENAMQHAIGTFQVKMQPVGELGGGGRDGNPRGRMSRDKTITGGQPGRRGGVILAPRSP